MYARTRRGDEEGECSLADWITCLYVSSDWATEEFRFFLEKDSVAAAKIAISTAGVDGVGEEVVYLPEFAESRSSALVRPLWFGVRKEKVKGEEDFGGLVRRWVRIWEELSICKTRAVISGEL